MSEMFPRRGIWYWMYDHATTMFIGVVATVTVSLAILCGLVYASLAQTTGCFSPHESGVKSFREGAFANAIDRFEKSLKYNPSGENASRARVYLALCHLSMDSHRFQTSDDEFRKAITKHRNKVANEEAFPEMRELWDDYTESLRNQLVERRALKKRKAAKEQQVLAAAVSPFAVSEHSGIEFDVSETAGIRRRSDVVTAHLALPSWSAPKLQIGFRLLTLDESGEPKVIPAQYHLVVNGETAKVIVDFIANFKPLETRRYRLEYGPELESKPISGGLKLTQNADEFRVDNADVVHWTLPRDLGGLLRFSWKDVAYVSPDSAGLYWTNKQGEQRRLDRTAAGDVMASRQGPIAVALRWSYPAVEESPASVVEMEFYRTKSWVHVTWEVDDDSANIKELGMDLNLVLEGKEILLDYGGADFVYATVRANQSSLLAAGPRAGRSVPWKVLHGTGDDLKPLVIAPRNRPSPRVFGWVHAMDSERCTALAVANFAESTRDQIRVDGDGQMKILREFADPTPVKKKRLELWMHFVTMPVHIGARTSPRSMQEPLSVRTTGLQPVHEK